MNVTHLKEEEFFWASRNLQKCTLFIATTTASSFYAADYALLLHICNITRERSSSELGHYPTHPTDPFLILLSEEIMHYKAFNAKTLYIFYLEGEAFSRIANCIALAHLLLMILSSYFPFSCHFSWNVISPLISSPTLSLNWHDEMTKRLLKIWDRDNAWPWQNEGSKLGFWRCIFIVSSAAKAAKAFFRPFPPLARTPELKLAEEAFRICLLHAQIASSPERKLEVQKGDYCQCTPV